MKNFRQPNRGFTLIELMITVGIIGILSAIAIPSYLQYVQNGKRADARAGLLQATQYMQRFYSANDRYDADRSGAAIVLPSALGFIPQGSNAATGDYQLTSNIVAQSYTLGMAPINSMAADKCGNLSVTNLGIKGFTPPSGSTATLADCWK